MVKTEMRLNGQWYEVYIGNTYLTRFKNKNAAEQFSTRIDRIMSRKVKVDTKPINIYF